MRMLTTFMVEGLFKAGGRAMRAHSRGLKRPLVVLEQPNVLVQFVVVAPLVFPVRPVVLVQPLLPVVLVRPLVPPGSRAAEADAT